MRTTLTLDDDVAALARQQRTRSKVPFKQVINDALRIGLVAMRSPAEPRSPFRTTPVDLGRCLMGDFADVAEALVQAEGDSFR